jgi:hypothetical protein
VILSLALVAAAFAPQDSAAAAPAPAPASPDASAAARAAGWKRLDAIFLVVNEDALTFQDFYRQAKQLDESLSTPAEEQEVMRRTWVDAVSRMLKVQAGKDLGFDPALVKRYVDDEMDRTVERVGSVSELGAELARIELNPERLREGKEEAVYSQLWEGSVDGRAAGPRGRPYVDSFVRPGKLKLEHARNAARAVRALQVTLQHLVVSVEDAGGAAQARELAASLRERILAGEDFGLLAEQYGVESLRPTQGLDEPKDLERLIASSTEDAAAFLRTAKVGDVSGLLPFRPGGELRAFRLLKVVALEVGAKADEAPPDFASRAIQEDLRKAIETRERMRRRERALQRLLDAAYVWPPEAFGRAREAGGAR